MHKKVFSKKVVALLILLFIVVSPIVIYFLGGALSDDFEEGFLPVQDEPLLDDIESYVFVDDELGIQMNVPKTWGEVQIENDFSGTQILKMIRFSDQPRVTLTTFTPKRLYPADFRGEGIAPDQDIVGYCKSQIANTSVSEEGKAAEDLFRLNGGYYFGSCDDVPPYLNRAQKTSEASGGWLPLEEDVVITSEISLSKSYFWALDNPFYPVLTLKVGLPSIQTDGFCLNHQTKSFRCMNHFEKTLIDSAFGQFSSQSLSDELEYVASTLQVSPPKTVQQDYEAYFSEWSTFSLDDFNIQLDYPTVFGTPEYDPEGGQLRFSEDDNHIFQMYVRTLEHVENEFEALEACEGPCIEPQVSKEIWEFERSQLESGNTESVECRFGRDCQLIQVGDNPMLVRYFNQWPITDGFRKEYTFYLEDARYDIYLKSDDAYTGDLDEFKVFEATDFTLHVLEEMVESIEVIE